MNTMNIVQAMETATWRQQAAGTQTASGVEGAFSMLLLNFLEEEGLPGGPVKEFTATEEADRKLESELALQMLIEMLLQKGVQLPEELVRQAGPTDNGAAPMSAADMLRLLYGQQKADSAAANPENVTQQTGKELLGETARGGSPQQAADLQQQGRFQAAVYEAQQRLSAQSGREKGLDIEALQAAVDSGKYQHAAMAAKPTGAELLPDVRDLADQLKAGLNTHLSRGESEFVVRLKPEGLGEITVRLLQREGGMTLSILAASAQVAKLINQELPALQNAMRPLHVEVGEISSATQTAQYQSSTDQNHFFRQQYEEQARNPANTGGQETSPEPEREEYIGESTLNTYI